MKRYFLIIGFTFLVFIISCSQSTKTTCKYYKKLKIKEHYFEYPITYKADMENCKTIFKPYKTEEERGFTRRGGRLWFK